MHFIFLVLSAQLALAGTQTSTVTRDKMPDGSWAFTFAGTCDKVKKPKLPLGVVETIQSPEGKELKLDLSAPQMTDTDRKGQAFCAYRCPAGSQAIALSVSGDISQKILLCAALK